MDHQIVKKGRGINLIHRGFQHSKDKRGRDGKQYWKCIKRSCPGRIHTTGEMDALQIVKTLDHDHQPDLESVNTSKIKSDLCERAAAAPTVPLKEVYRTYINSTDAPDRDDDFLEPQISSCRSQMYRARRRNMPPLPATRADINIQGQWSTTNDNNRFLLHQDDQMIIFSTDENLQKLSEADQVFMDGTFKVAPALFMQLFSLHIIFRGFFLPLVYALLPSKSSETYYSFFEILKRKMATLNLVFNPDTFMLDYESGILPTLRLHFPTSTIKGCNFHFSQAVWRRVQNLGLSNQYEEPQVGRIIRSLMALPFVPRMFVRQQFNNIEGSNNTGIQAVAQLLEYFKTTWIDGQFGIQMWNVHKQDIRTNNKLEGWHNSLNRSAKKAHPNIYELILTLKAEQSSTEQTIRSALHGVLPPPMRKKYREREDAIKQLEQELESGTRNLEEYLTGIRRYVGFK